MKTKQTESFDISRRRLCPDGACIGLLGDDNRCKVCGATYSHASPPGPISSAQALTDEAEDEDAREDVDAAEAVPFDPSRRLCDDGACVGIIGPDGRCTACGQTGAV